MGSCATSTKQPHSKKSCSTTQIDSPTKKQHKLSDLEIKHQEQTIQKDKDPYFTRYKIKQADFKQYATSKSQIYYQIFYKFRMLVDQIGEVNTKAISSQLLKNLSKIKLIRDKVDHDFKITSFNRASGSLPILNEEVLIYSFKYSNGMVNILEALEKDPKYEEMFPILSFSFRDIKNKLQDFLKEADTIKAAPPS